MRLGELLDGMWYCRVFLDTPALYGGVALGCSVRFYQRARCLCCFLG